MVDKMSVQLYPYVKKPQPLYRQFVHILNEVDNLLERCLAETDASASADLVALRDVRRTLATVSAKSVNW